MPDRRDRTDSLLDEIDQLVNDSLERGDQSGTWRGERYDKCSLCGDDYHHLAITTTLVQMRHGSYGQDEFGQGIVDPDYVYDDDLSPIVCPGSNYLGPPVGDREWAWYLIRKRGRRPSPRSHPASASRRTTSSSSPRPLGRRRLRTWRFIGPFDPWVIDMRTDIEYVSDPLLDPLPRAVGCHNFATFHYQDPYPIPSVEWRRDNREMWTTSGTFTQHSAAIMKPIEFEYTSVQVIQLAEDQGNEYPSYVDFTTDYPLWVHQWWLPYWQLIDPTNQQVIPLAHRRIPNGRVVIAPHDEYFEVANEPPITGNTLTIRAQNPIFVMDDDSMHDAGWRPLGTIADEGVIYVPTVRGPQGTPAEAPYLEG